MSPFAHTGAIQYYQKQLSKIDWSDYDVKGAAADIVLQGKTGKSIGRVKEEPSVSNTALAVGVLGSAALMGGYLLRTNGYLSRIKAR